MKLFCNFYSPPVIYKGNEVGANEMCGHVVRMRENEEVHKSFLAYLRSEVTLRLTVSQSVSMSWRRAHLGTSGQILILPEFFCRLSVGRPL
jgi:hypothetical protein